MQFSGWKRLIFSIGVAIVLLLGIVITTAPVIAGPNSAPPVQRLPTRQKPTATKKPSNPSPPTATPVPAATETLTPTNTPAPTATWLPTSTPAATATPTTTPTTTNTPTPVPITLAGRGSLRGVVLPPEGRIEITFGQLTPGVQTLDRDNLQAHYALDIPGNLQVLPTDSYIDLISSHVPQEPDKPSTLEVEVNGRPLSAIALTPENASLGQTRVELPARLLEVGTNFIVVRLKSGTACEDSGALLTVEIDESSLLSFGYEQAPYQVDLARYPLPFAEKGPLRAPVTLVLPDQPTSSNLSAAMTLAAGLGQASQGEVDLRAIPATAFDAETYGTHHLIVLGRPDTNALLETLDPAPAAASADSEPEQGFLELMASPWSEYRLLLIVSGADDQGISKASHVLNLRERFPPIRGSEAVVADVATAPESAPPQNMTLKSLGGQDETIYGAQPTKLGYSFMLPPGAQLTGTPAFTLRFSHSNILDPARSVIEISLNGQPVGNAVLDNNNATEGEWAIPLSQRALQPGRNQLEIGIAMILPGTEDANRCELVDDRRLWTVISSESEILIPYAIASLRPDLGHWPYPYGQRSGIGQSVFVLPDQPDATLVSDLLALGARLGAATDVDNVPAHVAYASEADQESWQDSHLVLLGRATQNALLRELNSHLPRPFAVGQESGEQDSDVLAPVAVDEGGSGQPTSAAFQLDPERDTGVLQTANSPWDQEKALLAVAGTTERGVRLAIQALLEPTEDLEGNIAIIDLGSGGTDLISVYATDTRPENPPVDSGPQQGPPARDTTFQPNTILLAQRWWK